MGYATTDTGVAAGLALGTLAGVGAGLRVHAKGRTIVKAAVLNSDSSTNETIGPDANHQVPKQVRQVGTGLL